MVQFLPLYTTICVFLRIYLSLAMPPSPQEQIFWVFQWTAIKFFVTTCQITFEPLKMTAVPKQFI